MTRKDPGWVPLHVAVQALKKEGFPLSPWYLPKWMRDVEVKNLRARVPYVKERDVPRIREMYEAHVVELVLTPRPRWFDSYTLDEARDVRDRWLVTFLEVENWLKKAWG